MNQKNVFRKKHFQFFRRNLAIDMGTSYTVVWSPRKGMLLQEPTVLAIDSKEGNIHQFGKKAWEMIGKNPQDIRIVRPIRAGVIANFNYTVKLLKVFISRLLPRSPFVKMRLIMTIPYGTTQVERQAMITTGKRIGIKNIYLIEEPLAAAIGAGIPIEEARGCLLVNLGGGVTEIALMSLGGIVKATTLRQGGEDLDTALQRYIHKKYRLEIGQTTATRMKEEAGYALKVPQNKTYEVKGFNWATRKPDRIKIPYTEINEAMEPILETWCSSLKKTFEQASPQLASDIIKQGILLTGGGSLLRNIDVLMSKELHLDVKRVNAPFYGAAKGASQALHFISNKQYLDHYRA